jgi:UDP-glucose 4-epimerase
MFYPVPEGSANRDAVKGNILITGASGFIGSFLVEAAIRRGYRTFAGTRPWSSREYLRHKEIQLLEIHFSSQTNLEKALTECCDQYGPFDIVIHAAGLSKARDPLDYHRVNFEYTRNLVEVLKKNELLKRKFVYISSLSSFGPAKEGRPITTRQSQQPVSDYGKSKLRAEQFLEANADIPYVIVNPTAVYGPRDKGFLPAIQLANRNISIRLTRADQQLSLVHVEDLCEAVFLAAESAVQNQRFLVSDLQVYSAQGFSEILGSCLNKRTFNLALPGFISRQGARIAELSGRLRGKPPLMTKDRLKDLMAANWAVDCEETQALGYTPRFSLETGLQDTIRWYKESGWL